MVKVESSRPDSTAALWIVSLILGLVRKCIRASLRSLIVFVRSSTGHMIDLPVFGMTRGNVR